MKVHVDGEVVELAGQTVGELLDAASERLNTEGRVIAEVVLSGGPLVGDGLEDARDDEVADGALSLVSEDARALALMALDEIGGVLDEAEVLQTEAADLLQEDEPLEAYEKVGQAMGIWLQAQQAVAESCLLLALDLEEIAVGDERGSDQVEHLRKQLGELREQMLGQDTVALADSLAYEWPDAVERWRELVSSLKRTIEDE
ncbi:hypothetical protein [Mucisphaera sp.]|uniref:hypothetical protein n=1 Tax=Mucisphaera sp. TaxID=2913024 RepID=UPI003D0B34C2